MGDEHDSIEEGTALRADTARGEHDSIEEGTALRADTARGEHDSIEEGTALRADTARDEHGSIEEGTALRADTARAEDGSGAEESIGDRDGDGLASNTHEAHPIVSCAGERAASAPYEIRSRSVDGDVLRVVVTYGGGCAPHDFRLCYEPELLETNPVQVNLRLDHDAHGDACQRIDRRVLEFDLQPLRDHYRAADPNGDTIVLNLGEPITYEL